MAYFTPPLLQGLVDLWLGEGGIGAHEHVLALLLLPFDLRQEHLVPVFSAVDVPRPQLHRQTVAFPIEQQQRVIAGGLEMSVVGALLLVAVDRDLRAVDVQYHPLR